MSRRTFIIALGCTAASLGTFVVTARAQERSRLIAVLGPADEPRFSEITAGLQLGLRDHGYSEATILLIEGKVTRGNLPAARTFVEEALLRRVAVLFVIGSELTRAARQVSSDLPIVFITPGDPVAAGLVASLAHPGGNTTAMTFEFPELSAKRLEFLKELAPSARRVLTLYDPQDVSSMQSIAVARATAPTLSLALLERKVRSAAEVARALEALDEADAFLAIPGGVTTGHFSEIIHAANAKRIPTFIHSRTALTINALASYGASDVNIARQAAKLVDKIVKGAKAGDLPVERPSRLEFVINLETARTLGLTIPTSLLGRADEIIE
ncbi:ABC transporter substrate-binding protein [Reyranella sp.]|uniref:ABC transporter substrate-binding protein n=1 Tax=Reyranella sp. TaxID=1929291 RepID=UPI002731726F|nr:ABC transporter substrate-binding protein [Reyranella sp.]MDP2375856.1 ABC transporter substrate-binding protein [Reyranella sp.]